MFSAGAVVRHMRSSLATATVNTARSVALPQLATTTTAATASSAASLPVTASRSRVVPAIVYIPAAYAHSFTSVNSDLSTLLDTPRSRGSGNNNSNSSSGVNVRQRQQRPSGNDHTTGFSSEADVYGDNPADADADAESTVDATATSDATAAAEVEAVEPDLTTVPRRPVRARPSLGNQSFSDLKVPAHITGMLKSTGLTAPSAIQRLALPFLLRRWDREQGKLYAPPTVALQDYTGSGKTLAYAIPLVSAVDNYIDARILPPQVVGAIHRLRGIPLPPPPPLAAVGTMADERARHASVEYRADDAYDPDASFTNNNSSNNNANGDGYGEDTASSVEARTRVRRNAYLRQKLREVFPTLPDSQLDPEAPQSRLQGIVIVPTKELAHQVAATLGQLNGDGSKARRKNPVVVATCAGRVTAAMLHDLGLGLRSRPGQDEQLSTPAPFVEFGKGHALHRPDQAEQRSLAAAVEKDETMRELYMIERAQETARLETVMKSVEADRAAALSAYRSMDHSRLVTAGVSATRLKLPAFSTADAADHSGSSSGGKASQRSSIDGFAEADIVEVSVGSVNATATLANSRESADAIEAVLLLSTAADSGDLPPMLQARAKEAADGVRAHHALVTYEDQRRGLSKSSGSHSSSSDGENAVVSREEQVPLSDDAAPEVDIAVSVTPEYVARQEARALQADRRRSDREHWNARSESHSSANAGSGGDGDSAGEQQARRAFDKEELEREMSYESAAYAPLVAQLGGAPDSEVEVDRKKQPHIVVGTPETIAALVRSGALQLPSTAVSPNQLRFMVFDEVDHLARNENSTGHRAVLELMSLPTDQTVFVSASMTRETAVFMTRMSRRQSLFGFTAHPTLAPTLTQYTLDKAREAREKRESSDTSNVTSTAAVEEYPCPSAEQQRAIAKLGLPIARSPADAAAEVLFLTPEDYRDGETRGESETAGARALPLPPYLKHYYMRVPAGSDRYKALMDVMCQLKHKSASKRRLKLKNPITGLSASASGDAAANKDAELAAATSDDGKSYAERVKAQELREFLSAQDKAPLRPLANVKINEEDMIPVHGQSQSRSNNFSKSAAAQFVAADSEPNVDGDGDGDSTAIAAASSASASVNPSTTALASTVAPGSVLVFFNKSAPVQPERGVGVLRSLQDAGLATGAFTDKSTRGERAAVLKQTSSNPALSNSNNSANSTNNGSSVGGYVTKKKDLLDVILATESIARGMDLPNLSLVVNADVPRSTASYLHRAGRVARLGGLFRRKGVVLSLISDETPEGLGKHGARALDDEALLRKHGEALGIAIRPWPYKAEPGLHKQFVRDEDAIMRDVKSKELRQIKHLLRVDATRAANPRATAGMKMPPLESSPRQEPRLPSAAAAQQAKRQAKQGSRRGQSLADNKSWMTWDGSKKAWKV